ncbi:Phosphatidylinositol/phosphatidylcholine transfer protein SFH4 [Folsomia candida]|uniref:Phosphatidylinositol/phosphatidylcholine transfer protein SFH4 n=1 Tax=Folsomia candida TaxID=158441 RepID=A0A226DWQ1_FOLCA|nr:Phosphatidylinositol/phosphatidylcholine transfer protein SFH4 [Folsomia candida]
MKLIKPRFNNSSLIPRLINLITGRFNINADRIGNINQAKGFNIPAAENMLMENLKWRRANNMDNILKENWSDFDQDFRSEFLGCDKEGSPVISIPIRDWNVRRAVMAGQSRKLMRYLDKQLEEVATLMREARQNGQNMTQFKRIMDMTNFDFRIQACPLCPPIFVSLWKIVRDFLPPGMKDILMLYGKDKTEWKTALLKEIDASQLTKEFGGQNDEGFSMGDVIKCSSLSITQAKRNLN